MSAVLKESAAVEPPPSLAPASKRKPTVTQLATMKPAERAVLVLNSSEAEKKLTLLVAESKTITEVLNKDAREQCHSAYMLLKNTRVGIGKAVETATEDAKAFSKAVKTEGERLVGIITAEEERLKELRDAWDVEEEKERQRKIEDERQRVATIHERIAEIRNLPVTAAMANTESVLVAIAALEARSISEAEFAEYADMATEAKEEVLEKLLELHEDKARAEAAGMVEAERQAKERAELEAERARQAEERRIQQQADDEARRAREAEFAEQQRKLAEQQEAMRKQQEVLDARQRQMDAEREAEAQERQRQALLEAEQARAEAAQAEADAKESSVAPSEPVSPAPAFNVPAEPATNEIVHAVAAAFVVPPEIAVRWLSTIDFSKVTTGYPKVEEYLGLGQPKGTQGADVA